ncbi:hypothetical protein O6H91_06G133100 [Diphasiastrum complanatum]|uniref:Uncharacterized protein n=1 Tax=Diphasiastrum complanatum TaxID=34168 RepID=A0ACC2DIZ8_DIPCM|nr:hypothetical protein O6H91_06G133100 [Diphasiastrum complanatum]
MAVEQLLWCALAFVVAVYIILRSADQRRRIKGLPAGGSLGLPLIGETLQYLLMHESFMKNRRKQFGDVFKSHIFGYPTVISVDSEINKFVLQNEGKLFQANYPKSLSEVLGKYNMFIIDANLHKRMRGIALSFLNTAMLKDHLLHDVEEYVGANLSTWKNRIVNLQTETRAMTFYLIAKQIISFTPGGETDKIKGDYYEFTDAFFSLPFDFPGTKYARGLKARKRIVNKLSEVVSERRRQLQHDAHTDVLATVLQSERNDGEGEYTTEQIIDFLVGLLVAGHETTSTAMMMSVKFLTDNPNVLSVLREEHQKIREEKKQGDRITWEDYKKMSFTHNVINETLRLTNISHGVYRRALVDVEVKGYTIPEGWQVLSYYRANHLDGDRYKDPLKFNPWRWQDKNESGNHFSPFGGGIRLCPGIELARLEISLFFYFLLTQYRWEPVGKEKVSYFPLVRIAKGYPIVVTSLS